MMTKTNDKKTAQQAYIEWNVDFLSYYHNKRRITTLL